MVTPTAEALPQLHRLEQNTTGPLGGPLPLKGGGPKTFIPECSDGVWVLVFVAGEVGLAEVFGA